MVDYNQLSEDELTKEIQRRDEVRGEQFQQVALLQRKAEDEHLNPYLYDLRESKYRDIIVMQNPPIADLPMMMTGKIGEFYAYAKRESDCGINILRQRIVITDIAGSNYRASPIGVTVSQFKDVTYRTDEIDNKEVDLDVLMILQYKVDFHCCSNRCLNLEPYIGMTKEQLMEFYYHAEMEPVPSDIAAALSWCRVKTNFESHDPDLVFQPQLLQGILAKSESDGDRYMIEIKELCPVGEDRPSVIGNCITIQKDRRSGFAPSGYHVTFSVGLKLETFMPFRELTNRERERVDRVLPARQRT